MIWYMALFSVIGNAYVIYYRIQGRIKGNASQGVFVLHLSVSDFLMGMYLFIIAIADLEYRNIYGFNDGEWRYSTTCTIAGLLATTSSEASVIFIFLITIERYIVLKHPFSAGLVKKRRLILFVTLVAWLIAILFSVVPNLVYSDFYSRSTVCISLPLTPGKVSGWEYSTFLFIGFNMFIFMAIVIGQMLIYIQVKRMGKKIENDNSKREMAVFKSLSYVVLSDTFCWIPIIVIGLLASGGVNISSDVYAWVIVLILPINSALNPFIYTFSMIYRKYYDLYDYYPNISIINCKQTGKGLEYRGTISVTIYGKTCQRWDSQTPHAHTYDKDLPGNASVHENYCRNPRASDETVPWCYTTDKNIRWQYCGVPYCEVDFSKCKLTSEGLDYRGNVSRTASGKTCQRWDKQYPWTHTYTDLYGGNSVHENYCRNPKAGQDPSPWCFTTDDKVQWELCDIPVCECRDTQKGEAYIGKTSQTVDGRQCVRWDSVDDSHPDYFNVKFLTGSKSTHENYCRNPDNKIAPWCFTELVGGSWNYCNIPFCKRSSAECLTSPKGFDYFGTENRTVDNIDCQRWDTVKPHQHSFSKGFMGLSASEHENYCRNPDDDKLPWCYTVNSKIKFQYCNIPNCPEHSYSCVFSKENCSFEQLNNNAIKWVLKAEEGNCFACLNDGSCIENGKFCDMSMDCLDNSDEKNCVLECYTENKYEGFRKKTKFLHQCADAGKCKFDSQSKGKPGCSINSEKQWEECSIPKCKQRCEEYLAIVILVGTLKANRSGTIQIGKINYENGICADKDPCSLTQFQCEDGSCIPVGDFCNGLTNCANQEDESACKYNNNTSCLEYNSGCPKRCPAHCQCNGFIFKCSSPENVTKEVKVLDLSSNSFNVESLENFGLLIHLNLSSCLLSNLSGFAIRLNSSSLQNLDLSYNNIRNLELKAFDGLPNLLYLNISNNQITSLQMGFFRFTPKLRHLIIQNNNITEIPVSESYNRLNSSLELLDLQNNKLMTIQPSSLYWLKSVSKIVLRNNNITNTDLYFSTSMKMLYELDLSYNFIQNITDYMFNGLSSLRYLNLQNNLIAILDGFSFSTLNSLRTLNLAFNQIHTINRMAFENLVSLTKLNLTGNKLRTITPIRFVPLVKLEILDLSDNGLRNLEYGAFKGLESVKHLNIHSNKLTVSRTMFQGLCNLEWLQTDSYIICCAKPLTVDSSKCISPKDSISSCEQLINVGFLAQMIWYIALFSVVGNAYVIYYRIQEGMKSNASHGIFVLHLSVSDFLMGVYLFIIAIADLEYRNVYGFNDGEWRYSTACTIAGLLATTSSEASVIFICLITIERYIVLKHPFSAGFVKKRRVILSISFVAWLIAILFSVIPVLVYPDFYSRSTVCISLPLTPEKVSGWEYSTFLFLGFNMFIFMAIVIGQLLIFIQVKRMGKKINNDNSKREMAVLKSLSYVVLSDTFCWIPIIVIGLLASGGVNISSDVYAWVIVLVLPINSALNPFIYTFSMIFRQKKKSPRSPSVTLSGRVNGQRQSSK
uniref:G-protein coupled receptor GRL101 n=1 Tax=Magallana gigas TaxID=29159 RepID=K1R631_MAGGI